MRFLVWGAGAIGGTIGARLAVGGHDVTLVDVAAEHVEAITANGLRITGPVAPCHVRLPAFLPGDLVGEWDTIILATKAHHTALAVRVLAPHLAGQGCVISAQNGLNERIIAQVVGPRRTVGAFVNFGADYIAPGEIHYGGRGAVVLGEIDGQVTPRIEGIHRAWLDFDDRAIVTDNIWGFLWGKEAYGAMLFVTALCNESIADALAMPEFRDVYIGVAREAVAVATARDVTPEPFDGFDPRAFLPDAPREAAEESIDALVAFNRKSAKTHSGIWRDLAIARPGHPQASHGSGRPGRPHRRARPCSRCTDAPVCPFAGPGPCGGAGEPVAIGRYAAGTRLGAELSTAPSRQRWPAPRTGPRLARRGSTATPDARGNRSR